ncbi:alpha/beta-hydrolase [Gloeophyllum trabeum ATCC 11539]|uniref:Alpha/beta-hydrolase n=1 Tax=Gloeophyllum trabeum (strain ATCC 11539 / FP-39264 / Madison 617) TaxID=670483 RepID=S7QM20_GLOTA|nr:alpha/beta-hydrolase [Gloeophyllum trabeum ATCC 11539]EPQ60477.1 alpha/beta-hydrolase [Gloeophyllum trabeum ATCC 11539]
MPTGKFSLPVAASEGFVAFRTTPRRPPASSLQLQVAVLRAILIAVLVAAAVYTSGLAGSAYQGLQINWKSCGQGFDGYQCANITLPLNHHNESDPRTVTISVNRYLATNGTHRKGAVFINPGGPGGSGTRTVFTKGILYSKILNGQYDIIGFDPRGINQTRPYLSCFQSQFDQEVFGSMTEGFDLNLPIYITAEVVADLEKQIEFMTAAASSLAAKCFERVGEYMAYSGTEAVVRDIDAMSKLIEGEDARINFWGFSYGTIIGQYLVKILPPHRIGRVMIDGVVNPTVWSDYPINAYHEGLDNIDDVLSSFATACEATGDACALSYMAAPEILGAIDQMIDSLYAKPVPVTGLRVPAVAKASHVRQLLFNNMYRIQSWPDLAEHLYNGLRGNFSGIVNATSPKVDPNGASLPDRSEHATYPIFCSDTKPYDSERKPPSAADLAESILEQLKRYSYRMGDKFFPLSLCHVWEGVTPRRSRYEGTFELEDDALDTPILVLSNTFDPVTSLASAKYANTRLGNNARLVQQKNGWGHCSISQKSFCTFDIITAYMVGGTVPAEKHTFCDVDEKPFAPFNDSLLIQGEVADVEARKAWIQLSPDSTGLL